MSGCREVNRPLRRVALACLVLFGLLLLNANWVQVVKADRYRDDPRNSRVLLRTYERERGPIAVQGLDGRRSAVAESAQVDGPLQWLREYPGGPAYAHVTGYYSLVYGRTGIERAEDEVLSGEADELFVRRLSDYVTGREPQGGSVVLTLNPAAQAAAYEAMQGKRGAVVALDPRTGDVLAMVSLPSYDPARLSSFDPADIREYYGALQRRRGRPAHQPGDQHDVPAGLDLQGRHRGGGAVQRRRSRPRRRSRRRARSTCRRRAPTCRTSAAPPAPARPRRWPTRCASPATPPSARSA